MKTAGGERPREDKEECGYRTEINRIAFFGGTKVYFNYHSRVATR